MEAREAGRPCPPILRQGSHEPAHWLLRRLRPLLGEDARFVGEAATRTKQEAGWPGRTAWLFPVRWDEPFGMVMIEAMACGTPVVALNPAARCPRWRRTASRVSSSRTRQTCPRQSGKRATLIRVACRSHVERTFDVTVMAEGYERLYAHAAARTA